MRMPCTLCGRGAGQVAIGEAACLRCRVELGCAPQFAIALNLLGWSLDDAEMFLGVTRKVLRRARAGRPISREPALAIAKALSIPYAELRRGVKSPFLVAKARPRAQKER